MARHAKTIASFAGYRPRFIEAGHMPWPKIEGAAGVNFSASQRQEIFDCFEAYEAAFHLRAEASPVKDVTKLRNELLRLSEALIDLSDRFPQGTPRSAEERGKPAPPDQSCDLQIMYGSESFDFRETYKSLTDAANQMYRGLNRDIDRLYFDSGDTSSRETKSEALTEFIRATLTGSDSKPARSTQASGFRGSPVEHSRWGLAVGPKSNQFRKFASAVLERTITERQLSNAWQYA